MAIAKKAVEGNTINPVDEMKKAKFKAFVENIADYILKNPVISDEDIRCDDRYCDMLVVSFIHFFGKIMNGYSMNECSRVIMFAFSDEDEDYFEDMYSLAENHDKVICAVKKQGKTLEEFIKIIWKFKSEYSKYYNYPYYGKICVFTLLFALAVDKTDYEERLSMICDLAVILEVSEDEIYDMTQAVRFLYRDIKKADVQFRTETCKDLFSCLLK